MKWAKSRPILLVLAAAVVSTAAPSAAQAALQLYRQVFNPPPPDTSPAIGPWSTNAIGGYNGTYSGAFDPPGEGMRDAASYQPIGRTDPTDMAGTALYTGIGGPVAGNLRAFYTVDGQAGFSLVDPALYPDLTFNIWANTQADGQDDFGRFIFQGQTGGNRGPKQWYVSTSPMAIPTVDQGHFMNLRSLLYNPADGNWDLLTLDPTNTVDPVVGGPAGALPADTKIVGVGVLHSVTNPAPLPDFSNPDAFGSWNYADYRLTDGAIPEPASLVMLACAGLAALWLRRAK
jgi:hypothetical protein